jgi:hypothetical protein
MGLALIIHNKGEPCLYRTGKGSPAMVIMKLFKLAVRVVMLIHIL